jgi:phage shock protein C
MFCSQCGKPVDPSSRFCPACGATVPTAAPPPGYYPNTGKLTRPRQNRMIAGVCAGLALHYGWDLNVVRILTAVIMFFSAGTGIIIYLAAWVVIPEAPYALPAKGL